MKGKKAKLKARKGQRTPSRQPVPVPGLSITKAPVVSEIELKPDLPKETRRNLSELLFLYKNEPSLRDVYVEGSLDARIINWFASSLGLTNVVVYDINRVNIPTELINELGLEQNNNRTRVIALAAALEKQLGRSPEQVTCVVDSDFDHILNINHNYAALLTTDFTCMEMYLFDELVLNKVFKVVLTSFEQETKDIMLNLSVIVQELFLFRLMNAYLIEKRTGRGLTPVSYDNLLTLDCGVVKFDSETYLRSYLCSGTNACSSLLPEAKQFVDEQRKVLRADPRYQMHGHDFISILVWYVRKVTNEGAQIVKGLIEKGIFGCLEVAYLSTFPLFNSLRTRLAI